MKKIIYIIPVILFAIILIRIIKKRKNNNDLLSEEEEKQKLPYSEKKYDKEKLPYKKGQKGNIIKWVQESMNQIGNLNIATNGIFSQETENAVYLLYNAKEVGQKILLKINKQLKNKK